MKILQINTTVNSGSTGRIAEDIGKVIISNGGKSLIAFGRNEQNSKSELIKIGSKFDNMVHVVHTLLFDKHGLASSLATKKLIKAIRRINPDVVHLHNIHGYYLHVGLLSNFLKVFEKPVVWTFHDNWAFTGHCTYFDDIGCEKWKTGCFDCPKTHRYPKSLFLDRSKMNYLNKREFFLNINNLTIVTPSAWLSRLVKESFLKDYPVRVIHNGVDVNDFSPKGDSLLLREKYNIKNKNVFLGVASIWDKRKGFDDFKKLGKVLNDNEIIVLIGLSKDQQSQLPDNIIGLSRTESKDELAQWYSLAKVFINPTWLDNFPTTNIEALSCGTPVITYNTGGSPESIFNGNGFVIEKGDIMGIRNACNKILSENREELSNISRQIALERFDKNNCYLGYWNLYNEILN